MTFTDAIILIAGVVAIFIGITESSFQYAKDFFGRGSDKRAPTWLGKLLFIGIGLMVLAMELKHLLVGGR